VCVCVCVCARARACVHRCVHVRARMHMQADTSVFARAMQKSCYLQALASGQQDPSYKKQSWVSINIMPRTHLHSTAAGRSFAVQPGESIQSPCTLEKMNMSNLFAAASLSRKRQCLFNILPAWRSCPCPCSRPSRSPLAAWKPYPGTRPAEFAA